MLTWSISGKLVGLMEKLWSGHTERPQARGWYLSSSQASATVMYDHNKSEILYQWNTELQSDLLNHKIHIWGKILCLWYSSWRSCSKTEHPPKNTSHQSLLFCSPFYILSQYWWVWDSHQLEQEDWPPPTLSLNLVTKQPGNWYYPEHNPLFQCLFACYH